jgi:hypothetical protein
VELDDMKAKAREITAPAGGRAGEGEADGLLRAIRAADERAAGEARKATPFYAIAAAAFLAGGGLTLASVTPAAGSRALHFGVLGGVFLLLALLFRGKVRSLARTDYSRPVKVFLAEAERRYRFMRPVDLAYAIPLLLVLALTGGRLVVGRLVPRYVEVDDAAIVVWAYALFFLAVCGLGCYFTYRNWQKENGAIWAEIRRMRREME